MQKQRLWRSVKLLLAAGGIALSGSSAVFAVTSTSNNYQVSETQFNSGSQVNTCSGKYCAQVSLGDSTAGTLATSGSAPAFGPIQGDDPRLEVIVEPGPSNLGDLTTETTATKTIIVRIRNYLSDGGYILQMVGTPPKAGNHTLAAPTSATASTPGTEQFAINVADNSTPNVGSAPVQVPADSIAFGKAADDYKTANLFKYSSEDVIAQSVATSGRTDYTISMIVNISSATPAGKYLGDYQAVVTPVY